MSLCFSLLRLGSFSLVPVDIFSAAAALSAKNLSNSLLDSDSSISPPVRAELSGYNKYEYKIKNGYYSF